MRGSCWRTRGCAGSGSSSRCCAPGRWSAPDDLDESVDAYGRAASARRANGCADSGVLLTFADAVYASPNRRCGGIVTLAACTTHRPDRAYDEAVTLSTAFLVAGAGTAIGSLWQVPDDGTARRMVAFHHNLVSLACHPRAALRR
jgi:hypothetical protein